MIGDDPVTMWAGMLPLDVGGLVEPSPGNGVISVWCLQWTLGGKAHTSMQHMILQVLVTKKIRFNKFCTVVLDYGYDR